MVTEVVQLMPAMMNHAVPADMAEATHMTYADMTTADMAAAKMTTTDMTTAAMTATVATAMTTADMATTNMTGPTVTTTMPAVLRPCIRDDKSHCQQHCDSHDQAIDESANHDHPSLQKTRSWCRRQHGL